MSSKEKNIPYCRKVLFSVVALTIILASVYSNCFRCSWHFDDIPNIVENPRLHMENLDWNSLKKAIFSDRRNTRYPYRPVVCITFALNYYFGKLNVVGYHAVNLLIHLVTAILLFLFIYRTLEHLALTKRWSGDTYFVSLLSAILWAINPIQTQAVTYLVQRMASMAAMFYIMGMYFYLRARTAQSSLTTTASYTLCLLSFLLALGSKENAAMLPISIFLYEAIIMQDDVVRFLKRSWKWMVLAFGATLLIGASYFFFKTGKPYPDILGGYRDRPFTLWERLLTEPRVLLYYLSLLLYPMPNRLCLTHDFVISTSLLKPITTLLSIAAIFAIISGALLMAKKKPLLSFSVLFFFTNHLIESSIFPLELVFEHRNYLPSMFLFLPIADGLMTLVNHYKENKSMEYLLCGFVILLLVGLGHSTYIRNVIWRNDESLWLDCVEKYPHLFRAHHNLGKYYQDKGLLTAALEQYEAAISLKSLARKGARVTTYLNLGNIFLDLGQIDKAVSYYQMALKERKCLEALVALGSVYLNKGANELAASYFNEAQKIDPTDPYLNFNRGVLLLSELKSDEAIRCFRRSQKDKKLFYRSRICLGIAYGQKGELGKSFSILKPLLKLNPHSFETNLLLAAILHTARSRVKDTTIFANKYRGYATQAVSILFCQNQKESELRRAIKRVLKKARTLRWPQEEVLTEVLMHGIQIEEKKLTFLSTLLKQETKK